MRVYSQVTKTILTQHTSFSRAARCSLIALHTRQAPISFWTRGNPVEPEVITTPELPATAAAAAAPPPPPETPTISKISTRRHRTKLTPEKSQERFDQLFDFVIQRLGRRPAVKTPQVRQTAWTHLFELATTADQLNKVAELFPRWRDSKRAFDAHHAEQFVRRCEQLGCPGLALKVFGDHSKYGLALSLPAGRGLLHALHIQQPLADTIAAAALFRAHGLPAPSEDLVSCAMLISACCHHEHKQSGIATGSATATENAAADNPSNHAKHGQEALRVAQALVPNLRELLHKEGPVTVPEARVVQGRVQERPKVWLMRTMSRIEKTLASKNKVSSEGGWEWDWLRDWRVKSGHVRSGAGA